jgi:hypothetical protein
MTIDEALRAASEEYDEEISQSRREPGFAKLMTQCLEGEYKEIDRELPVYVGDIASALHVEGNVLPGWAYQMAIMCFRMGMRTQRKLDRPSEPTSLFWRSDKTAV